MQYPATLDVQSPDKIAIWRLLVHWLVAIPHLIICYVLAIVAEICALIAWFAILLTGKPHSTRRVRTTDRRAHPLMVRELRTTPPQHRPKIEHRHAALCLATTLLITARLIDHRNQHDRPIR